MNPDSFTPREILDILEQELQLDENDYLEIFQMLGVYAYKSRRITVQLMSNGAVSHPKTGITIGDRDIRLYSFANFNEEAAALLTVLGISFRTKGKSILLMSPSILKASLYQGGHFSGLTLSMIYNRRPFNIILSQGKWQMFTDLAKMYDSSTVQELRHKFNLELERCETQSAYNALSETLPEGSLITDSLPVQTMYQMLEEDRVRERRKYQR